MGSEKTENEEIYNTSDDNTNSYGGSGIGWIVFVIVLVGAIAFGTYEYKMQNTGRTAVTPAASTSGDAAAPGTLDTDKLPSAGSGTNLYAPSPSNNSNNSSGGNSNSGTSGNH